MSAFKQFGKAWLVSALGRQARVLQKKNSFKIVAVVGSYGKTSTKLGIATVLSEKFKVQFQDGNYNELLSVPLIFFGEKLPSLLNSPAWLKLLRRNRRQLKNYPYDVVVLELGTDGPGQIAQFKKYLKIDLVVVTAIAYEHMQFFDSLEAVADEELSVTGFAGKVLYNQDLCDAQFIDKFIAEDKEKIPYSFDKLADRFVTKAEAYTRAAATLVGNELGMMDSEIAAGLAKLKPVPGRMNKLKGLTNSLILDDTYNASPDATEAALDVLYASEGQVKIALLGNMNELGEFSSGAHSEIGAYCDPKKLSLVVTLGQDANKYIAEAAETNGCKVIRTQSPYEAGQVIKENLQSGAVVLAKGSQNGVFAEEAVKLLLANPGDAGQLVRQSPYWLKLKSQAFKKAPG